MGQSQEILFAKTLEEVKNQAKNQGGYIEEEQVQEAFAQLQLTEEQLALVFDYLKKHKIGIGEPVNPDEYLSEEEIDYLEEYQKELQALEKLTDGQKEAVILSAMAGEKEAQQKLVSVYLTEVTEIAKLYAGQGVLLEDLIGEGNVAVAMGVTMLGCLEHPGEADGMIAKMIMDNMEAYIAENVAEADKDKKVLERVNKVARKAKELSEEMRRKVTVEELSQEMGISTKAIQDAMRFSGNAIEEIE